MTEPLSQRDPRWASTYLGTSKTTIGDFGCTLTSLTMLLNHYGGSYTPDQVNIKLKSLPKWANGDTGFSQGNLIIWSRIKEAFPQVKSVERITTYNNDKVASNLPALVEVDGKRIGASKHWVLYVGNQKMNDSWFGNEKSTSYYPPTGCTIFKVERIDNTTDSALEACMADRKKFWAERDAEIEAHKATKRNHQGFVDQLADIYNSVHSEESVIKFATENCKVIDERNELQVKYEKEVQARKKDYEIHQQEIKGLQAQLDDLKAQNDRLASKLANLGLQITNKLEESDKAKEAVIKDEIEQSKSLWDIIKEFISKIVQTKE